MCTKAEVHAELQPLRDSIATLTKRFNAVLITTIVMLVSFLATFFFIGTGWGQLTNDVEHNREMLISRTEDRFYKQDGQILEEKFNGLIHRQEFLEEQYQTIDEKLDRLIESQ